jgi:IS5 family transposase
MQQSLPLSPYMNLYDIIVPKNHILRKWKELVDFGFIYEELADKYCLDNGRMAECPIRLFKYILLKSKYKLSDRDLVERSQTDMAFKYFLDYAPEDTVIDSTTLTKFRKLRLIDECFMNKLIKKSVEIAIENGVLKSRMIIVDSTHTGARFNQKSPIENILDVAKIARKSVYRHDETAKERMPEKANPKSIEEALEYAQKVAEVIENESVSEIPDVSERLNLLKEVIEDDIENLQNIQSYNDEEARLGHKSADTSYFGYKSHLAMSLERIIVAAVVTSGEKHDGKQLKEMVRLAKENGMNVKAIIGDMAYSEKENLKFTSQNNIRLFSKLSKTVTHGLHKNGDKFEYNKDADRYQCQGGHMSIKKVNKRPKKNEIDGEGSVETYFFDVDKCRVCPFREGCYKDGSKTKSYSVSIKSHTHQLQEEFQNTEIFRYMTKHRYMIEAKNGNLKNDYGLSRAQSAGLLSMKIQDGAAIFASNLDRIIKLLGV